MSQAEQPLISHLVELRTRLLRSISAILLAFVTLGSRVGLSSPSAHVQRALDR